MYFNKKTQSYFVDFDGSYFYFFFKLTFVLYRYIMYSYSYKILSKERMNSYDTKGNR